MRAMRAREQSHDGLTPSQRLALQVIEDSVRRHGCPPSIREIGSAVGLASARRAAMPWPGEPLLVSTQHVALSLAGVRQRASDSGRPTRLSRDSHHVA